MPPEAAVETAQAAEFEAPMPEEPIAAALDLPVPKPSRVWNFNFLLLWQGQLISALGDVVYGVALGFWILQKTGSTALMGALMAASTLPRIVISPFAGVLVDRLDRKRLLILSDAIRGIFVVLVGLAAYSGRLEIWMVFAAGIVISIGAAFFNPAVSAAIPDIVPQSEIVRANSAFAMIQTGSGILGNAAGGFLYSLLGAPLMFLANGISYLVAAVATAPIRIPRVPRAVREFRFLDDLKSGFTFVWRYRGIRTMIIVAAVLNFFAVMGIMLFLPLFEGNPTLGAARYGLVMAGLTGGMFAGYLLTSVVKFDYPRRFTIFYACGIVSMAASTLMPVWLSFPVMLGLGILVGVTNSVVNSFLNATFATVVPPEMRGKVFSLLGTISGGLMPLAFALGGALAEVISVRVLIAGAFLITLLCFLTTILSAPTRRMVNFDPARNVLEDIQ